MAVGINVAVYMLGLVFEDSGIGAGSSVRNVQNRTVAAAAGSSDTAEGGVGIATRKVFMDIGSKTTTRRHVMTLGIAGVGDGGATEQNIVVPDRYRVR
jgi:hypothetical protein